MANQCVATTRDGRPCAAKARRNSPYCPWHAPEMKARQREWSVRGGKGKAKEVRLRKLMPASLSTDDLLDTLSRIIKRVELGDADPGILTAIANAARTMTELRKAREAEDLLRRLEELERLAARGWSA